jgi:hypothetical protein
VLEESSPPAVGDALAEGSPTTGGALDGGVRSGAAFLVCGGDGAGALHGSGDGTGFTPGLR